MNKISFSFLLNNILLSHYLKDAIAYLRQPVHRHNRQKKHYLSWLISADLSSCTFQPIPIVLHLNLPTTYAPDPVLPKTSTL